MSNNIARFLGFAFASADLLLELDDGGRVVFAAGAAPSTSDAGAHALLGKPLGDLIEATSFDSLSAMLDELKPGRRGGPVPIVIKTNCGGTRAAEFCAFKVPELAPNLSCAINYLGEVVAAAQPAMALLDGDAFADKTRALLSQGADAPPIALALVELGGLSEATRDMDEAEAQVLLGQIEEILQKASVDGASATRVADERYAVIGGADASSEIDAELRRLASAAQIALDPKTASVSIGEDGDPLSAARALRFAVDSFIREGLPGDPDQMQRAFSAALLRAKRDAEAFRKLTREGRFLLHYQPVINLKTSDIHHHEVLPRFGVGVDSNDMLRLAEEMNLITEFNIAVMVKSVQRLLSPGSEDLVLAVKISAQSLREDRFVDVLMKLTAANPAVRSRLILEVSEGVALDDADGTNRRIQALRGAEFAICLGDFGAGASSLDFLRNFPVDAVKIDGRFIRDIANDDRTATLVAHLAELCTSLELHSIAKGVETREVRDLLSVCGVDFGQGDLFSPPRLEPVTARAKRAAAG